MTADLVAVDWGTSAFRLWVMRRDGHVLSASHGREGMQHCAEAGFAPTLAAHLSAAGAPQDTPILICGMAGARQGWVEAPYADLPAQVASLAQAAICVPRDRAGVLSGRDIRILPGLARRRLDAPDVMRGEETQLLGLASQAVSGLVCMPGTHSKWATLQDGAVTDFTTAMTGELFGLLSRYSILRHALPDSDQVVDPDDAEFLAGVDQSLSDRGSLVCALFGIRAAGLLGFRDGQGSVARLSGLLIGAEIAAQRMPSGASVTLLGQPGLGALYVSALTRAGAAVAVRDAETATQIGLLTAARSIWEF